MVPRKPAYTRRLARGRWGGCSIVVVVLLLLFLSLLLLLLPTADKKRSRLWEAVFQGEIRASNSAAKVHEYIFPTARNYT